MKCLLCNEPFEIRSKYNPNQKYCSIKCGQKDNFRIWQERNREHNIQRVREWKDNNPEKHKGQTDRYYEKHKEEIKERGAEWLREKLESDPDYYRNRYLRNKKYFQEYYKKKLSLRHKSDNK